MVVFIVFLIKQVLGSIKDFFQKHLIDPKLLNSSVHYNATYFCSKKLNKKSTILLVLLLLSHTVYIYNINIINLKIP